MNLGRIKSNKGLDVDQEEFGQTSSRSTRCRTRRPCTRSIKGRGAYLVGPLARLNLNAEKLHPRAAELLPKVCEAVGRTLPWRNNYLSLLARGLETVHALALAADMLGALPSRRRGRACRSRRGPASAATAPRPRAASAGTQYRTDADGTIASARIIPPTSQNQATIEADLRGAGRADRRTARRGRHAALRAPDPQLRPVHQLLGPRVAGEAQVASRAASSARRMVCTVSLVLNRARAARRTVRRFNSKHCSIARQTSDRSNVGTRTPFSPGRIHGEPAERPRPGSRKAGFPPGPAARDRCRRDRRTPATPRQLDQPLSSIPAVAHPHRGRPPPRKFARQCAVEAAFLVDQQVVAGRQRLAGQRIDRIGP